MEKLKILSVCLDLVSDECEIDQQAILSECKNEDVVDARHLLAKLMSECGLYPSTIALLIGCTSRNINAILSGFKARCDRRKLLRMNYERLRKHIGSIYLTDLN
jgi:hypothetical protein